MNAKIIIFYAADYEIKDEATGKVNSGVSIHYLIADSMSPYANDKTKGYRAMKGSLPREAYADLTAVPGLYDCEFTMKASASGKPELRPVSVDFIESF